MLILLVFQDRKYHEDLTGKMAAKPARAWELTIINYILSTKN